MPGPTPKRNPARRNRSSTSATLSLVHSVVAPDLPPNPDGWHALTLSWWADVWASPMAPEFHESYRHGLFLLAVLVDSFWRAPSEKLAAEIRLQRQCFGLTPIDRRRLQWEIERTDEAQAKGDQRRAAPGATPAPTKAKDPRRALTAV
jgi:hypothetical protein